MAAHDSNLGSLSRESEAITTELLEHNKRGVIT